MNLNQVTIYSGKPLETVDFYIELGLRLIVDSRPRYARLERPDGESTLSVQAAQNVSSDQNIVLYFQCDNLDTTVNSLKSKGFTFEQDPIDQPWLWREAYLLDPNSNRICLFHASENRKNPPWRVE